MTAASRCSIALSLLAAACLSGCGGGAQVSRATAPLAIVQHVAGSPVPRLVLSAQAAQRIGIETAAVEPAPAPARHGRSGHGHQHNPPVESMEMVPYPAVFYDADGQAFVYANPSPLVFVRTALTIDHISDDKAFTTAGPPVGARVVTTGADELLGVENGVQSE